MINPGAIIHGTVDHKSIVAYAKSLAIRYEIAEGPALGILLKLDDNMRKSADSELKISALIIRVTEDS